MAELFSSRWRLEPPRPEGGDQLTLEIAPGVARVPRQTAYTAGFGLDTYGTPINVYVETSPGDAGTVFRLTVRAK